MPSEADYQQAIALLRAGELVAFPTETVYGLGADAANPQAVARIFAAKGRPADHPLIVHLPGTDWVDHWAQKIPDVAWELMETFWPGPLTLILQKKPWVPAAVTGGQDTVGLRVPGHPVALELLRRFAAQDSTGGQSGIAAPSANRFGRISPTRAAHVREELGERVPFILDGGACQVGIESTIVDLSHGTPHILRPGHITAAHIAAVLGVTPVTEYTSAAPRVSGSMEAHYAPLRPLRLIAGSELPTWVNAAQQQGKRIAVLAYGETRQLDGIAAYLALPDDPVAYAHAFYAALRQLDQPDIDLILVDSIPTTPAWAAVTDRLRRAVAGSGQAWSESSPPETKPPIA